MNYALAQIYLLLSFCAPLCTLHLCVNFYYNPVCGCLCHHQRQQHPWPPLLNFASVVAVVVVIVLGSCLLLLAPSHPPNMPLLQTTCNSFSSLGPAQKQSWENCFCRPHWGRWCLSVGLLSSPLPILLLLLPRAAVDWHYVVTDFNCIPRKGDTHTHTYLKYHTLIHTCTSLTFVSHVQNCNFVSVGVGVVGVTFSIFPLSVQKIVTL